MCSIFGITLRLYIVIFVILTSGCAAKISIPKQQDDEIIVATPQSQNFQMKFLHRAANNVAEIRLAPLTPHIHNSKKYADIQSILVARNNKLVFEKYFNGASINEPHTIASVGKSLLSALVGIAISEGYIENEEESIYRFIKYSEYDHWDANKASIQLQHLLTMTAGWDCGDITHYYSHCGYMMNKFDDPYKWVLDLPMNSSPNNTFNYNDANPKILTAIVSLATNQNIAQYFHDKIMLPLKIKNNIYISNKLTSRDMLKIGLLYLNNGIWNGQQIIPKSWVEKSTSIQFPFKSSKKIKGYGYFWWQKDIKSKNKSYSTYYAAGAGGQYIIVVPSLELVTVFTGKSNYNMGQVFEIIEKFIIPSILDS